jgi:LacI family transcriptional regulator
MAKKPRKPAAIKADSIKTIALMTGNMSPHVVGVYTGIENKITKTGSKSYELVHYNTHYDEYRIKDQLQRIALGKKADCVIMLSIWPGDEAVHNLKKNNIPLIVIEKKVKGVFSIIVDNYQGAYMATEYLIKKGRKKIAFIRGESQILRNGELSAEAPSERQHGYMDALIKNNMKFDYRQVYTVSHAIRDDGYQVFDKMKNSNNMPDAVFSAAGDTPAMGFIEAAMNNNLVIPQDISVIGYDDVYSTILGGLPLTTVRQPLAKIGEEAFDIAVGAITGTLKGPKNIVFEPELVIRNSA